MWNWTVQNNVIRNPTIASHCNRSKLGNESLDRLQRSSQERFTSTDEGTCYVVHHCGDHQLWCVLLSVSSLCPSSCLSYSTSLQSLLYLLLTLLISSLSTRVPSHTDTMLPALCSLFTALSCVSGVTVVTQKPPVLTLTQGQTATMDCNLGNITDQSVRWYKQVPGGVPQHVIRHHQSWSSPAYGSGFSSPKFTSTCSSASDCNVVISNVEVGDSAVYYCNIWDDSAKEHVSQ
ncbi:uncharacterized protein LOC128511940 [Clarias gariepinus]|uniref:uncharacterized protein LOC128511940 n=1 Tax=Clarias gariepinus TaxID=13013 RepID=UPI00234D2695|nr:uncharacterized protein LOC128511940 [Clarias gariepinus]